MANLKTRLSLIRQHTNNSLQSRPTPPPRGEPPLPPPVVSPFRDWKAAAPYLLTRTCEQSIAPYSLGALLCDELDIVISPFAGYSRVIHHGAIDRATICLFDLETTGLSGGAGTVAFLAAIGQFVTETTIAVTQYLVLDYPGEYDFCCAVADRLSREPQITLVTYNGKSFDAPLFNGRCLMNGVRPPPALERGNAGHIDLLYPARRLWKRRLPSCAQGVVEAEILGSKRANDLPGSAAPAAWFTFLKTGEAASLRRIGEHNLRDIAGLAGILSVINAIAASPLKEGERFNADFDALARLWRRAEGFTLRTAPFPFFGNSVD